jgi:DNA polymerase III subunit epsilon
MKLLAIDFETANQYPESACSIGLVQFDQGELILEQHHLIKPHPRYAFFSPTNISIHGIHPHMVENAQTFDLIYPNIYNLFEESVLIAHSAPFDVGVLRALQVIYGLSYPNIRYIDSVEIARKVLPFLQNHRLNTVSAYFDIDLQHHDALSDARASGLIALHTMAQLQNFDLEHLMAYLNLPIRYLSKR